MYNCILIMKCINTAGYIKHKVNKDKHEALTLLSKLLIEKRAQK